MIKPEIFPNLYSEDSVVKITDIYRCIFLQATMLKNEYKGDRINGAKSTLLSIRNYRENVQESIRRKIGEEIITELEKKCNEILSSPSSLHKSEDSLK